MTLATSRRPQQLNQFSGRLAPSLRSIPCSLAILERGLAHLRLVFRDPRPQSCRTPVRRPVALHQPTALRRTDDSDLDGGHGLDQSDKIRQGVDRIETSVLCHGHDPPRTRGADPLHQRRIRPPIRVVVTPGLPAGPRSFDELGQVFPPSNRRTSESPAARAVVGPGWDIRHETMVNSRTSIAASGCVTPAEISCHRWNKQTTPPSRGCLYPWLGASGLLGRPISSKGARGEGWPTRPNSVMTR